MKAIKHFIWSLVFLLVVVIGGAIAYAYSGGTTFRSAAVTPRQSSGT